MAIWSSIGMDGISLYSSSGAKEGSENAEREAPSYVAGLILEELGGNAPLASHILRLLLVTTASSEHQDVVLQHQRSSQETSIEFRSDRP